MVAPHAWGGLDYGAGGLALKTVLIQALTVNVSLVCCGRIIPIRLPRLWLHQVLALLFFVALAALPLGLEKLVPGLWTLPALGLPVLTADILGLVLRGTLYTALVVGGVLACPWLVGLTRGDLREMHQRMRRRKEKGRGNGGD